MLKSGEPVGGIGSGAGEGNGSFFTVILLLLCVAQKGIREVGSDFQDCVPQLRDFIFEVA